MTTMVRANHIGKPRLFSELIAGAQIIAINPDSRNGTISVAAAFIPATIMTKLATPNAIRNALPFSWGIYMTRSVKLQVSSVKIKKLIIRGDAKLETTQQLSANLCVLCG